MPNLLAKSFYNAGADLFIKAPQVFVVRGVANVGKDSFCEHARYVNPFSKRNRGGTCRKIVT